MKGKGFYALGNTVILVKGKLPVKYAEVMHQDGTRSINLKCCSKDCDRKCAMYFETPNELWNVPAGKLAAKLSLLCSALAKEDAKIKKLAGQQTAI